MVALLKYGAGVPFKRLERLQAQMGMPLPAATQWELMAAAAIPLRLALEELIRQAAQGRVMHNDDIRPISARYPAGLILRASERILVNRLESRSRERRGGPSGKERRNISMAC